jgi:hypothetical protein
MGVSNLVATAIGPSLAQSSRNRKANAQVGDTPRQSYGSAAPAAPTAHIETFAATGAFAGLVEPGADANLDSENNQFSPAFLHFL